MNSRRLRTRWKTNASRGEERIFHPISSYETLAEHCAKFLAATPPEKQMVYKTTLKIGK